jgi:hypothetical protein
MGGVGGGERDDDVCNILCCTRETAFVSRKWCHCKKRTNNGIGEAMNIKERGSTHRNRVAEG